MPDTDLFGDIDGFSILDLWQGVGGTLADVLTQYYLGGAGVEAGYHCRFRTFIGAHFGDPGTDTDFFPGVTRVSWLKRINRFNDVFAAGAGTLLVLASPPFGTWKYSEKTFDRFLSWLFTRLAIEISLHP
jgi:hypothetical protein